MKRILFATFLCMSSMTCIAQNWDMNLVSWDAPQKCADGTPIAQCVVTSYKIERSATSTGTFAEVGTVNANAVSFIHSGAAEGQNCYRIIAMVKAKPSDPSNVSCRTNTRPDKPSEPPRNLTVTGVTAYNIRVDYSKFAFVKGSKWGTATKGAACDESRCIEGGYCVVSSRRSLNPRPPEGEYKVARCG